MFSRKINMKTGTAKNEREILCFPGDQRAGYIINVFASKSGFEDILERNPSMRRGEHEQFTKGRTKTIAR